MVIQVSGTLEAGTLPDKTSSPNSPYKERLGIPIKACIVRCSATPQDSQPQAPSALGRIAVDFEKAKHRMTSVWFRSTTNKEQLSISHHHWISSSARRCHPDTLLWLGIIQRPPVSALRRLAGLTARLPSRKAFVVDMLCTSRHHDRKKHAPRRLYVPRAVENVLPLSVRSCFVLCLDYQLASAVEDSGLTRISRVGRPLRPIHFECSAG